MSDTLIEFARKTRLKYLKNTHNYHEGLIELEDSIYNIWQERFKTLNKSQSNKSEKEKDGMPF